MLHTQAQETMEMGIGKSRRLSLDAWIAMPVCAAGGDFVSDGPCTPEKAHSHAKSSLTAASFSGGEAACETPQSSQHRIPAVDIDLCPPAPKKPRGMRRRLVFTCSTESENANTRQKLGLAPSYLF